MKISIIIPVYNAEKYLDRCMRSVVASLEEFGGKGEIIAVNNNSKDGSMHILREWKKKLSQNKALALRTVECQEPGAGAARNLGAREAKGDYLWFIDADDTISKH